MRPRWGDGARKERLEERGIEGEDLKCPTQVRKEHETKTSPLRTLLKEKCTHHKKKKQCAERARESKDGGASF